MRVLIIDDESDLREVLALEFQMMGHQVAEAACGRDGISMVEAQQFDVVLCDLKMPRGDGFEFLSCLRESQVIKGSKPPVILMTGLFDFDNQALLDQGAFGVVSKPFDWPAIRELLAKIGN